MTASPPPPAAVPPDPALAARLARRRWAWTLLWCLIIFGSGAATGWGVSRLLGRRPPEPFRPEPPIEPIVRRMARDLDLSDAQVREITDVYRRRGAALQEIRRQMAPRFAEEYDKLQSELKRILTPEQFAQWEPRFEEIRRRMLPPAPPHGRPPGGPRNGPLPGGPREGAPPGGPGQGLPR